MDTKPDTALFFAGLLCPQEQESRIHAYKLWMKEQYRCRVALKSPAHITLIPPFRVSAGDETRLMDTLQAFTSDLPELLIQLNGFHHFGKRVIYVQVNDNAGLQKLKTQTMTWFQNSLGNRIPADNHPFHPHISIATRDLAREDFDTAWSHFNSLSFQTAFYAHTLSLLRLTNGNWITAGEKKWS